MKPAYRLLLLMNTVSMGLLIPVLSLLLMEKGCTLGELAFVMGLFSLTVFVLELPSGVLADMIGRKAVFLLSGGFYMAASVGMLFFSGFVAMIPLIVLFGAGRAFASGSLDALLIDEHIARYGMEALSTVTLELSLIETLGISIGAMLGGLLPTLLGDNILGMGKYAPNLILRCLFTAAVIIIAAIVLQKTPTTGRKPVKLKQHVAQSLLFVKGNDTVLPLLFGVFLSGVFLFSIETYWQPALLALLPDLAFMWVFGLLSFCCFICAALGNLLAKRLMDKTIPLHRGYTVFRLAIFFAVILLATMKTAVGFGIAYCTVYFALGTANLFESNLINRQTPAQNRASVLSLVSFALQAGGMSAPVLSAFVVPRFGIQAQWGAIGTVFIVIALWIGVALSKAVQRSQLLTAQKACPE